MELRFSQGRERNLIQKEMVDSKSVKSKAVSNILAILGPRGVGKSTVVHQLYENYGIQHLPSYTTRDIRPGEIDGQDHQFVSAEYFDSLVSKNKLYGINEIRGVRYGINIEGIKRAVIEEKIYTINLDMQTAVGLRNYIGGDTVKCIGLLPRSWQDIALQMKENGVDEAQIKHRLENDPNDFSKLSELDFIVVNERGKLDATVKKIAERCLNLATQEEF